MRILKFGGTSVANADRLKEVIQIVDDAANQYLNVAVVVSAQSGVTDELEKLCELIIIDKSKADTIVKELEQKNFTILKELLPVAQLPSAMAEVMSMINELSDIVKGASLVGEVTARTKDLIFSFGERISAFVISEALKTKIPDTIYADARQFVRTDSNFGYAKVDFETSNKLILEYFSKHNGLKVVTGFIGSAANGQTTTLGRSGSDYTASILGAALHAEAIEIWTDVDGVMTADPRFVVEAQSIAQLSYNEAMELSHFGAKVIFPATMQPAMAQNVPIWVKNTFNPNHKGTCISKDSDKGSGIIKGITSLKNICLISVEGSGMVGVAGVSSRLFSTLSLKSINVILISKASSEHSICIAVMRDDADRACLALRETFVMELNAGQISSINYESNLAIVAIVGENMKNVPGVIAKVFSPLGRNGINVKAISQGSSELNISIAINEKDLKKALRVLHQSLFSKELQQLHLYIAGTGSVGTRLLEMIKSQQDYLESQKISLKLCGLINSRKMILNESNIDITQWKNNLDNSSETSNLLNFTNQLIDHNIENSVFIDITASDEPTYHYVNLLSKSVAIVAANKRANSQSMVKYKLLKESSLKRNIPFHYETNVCAGLPVINALRSLIVSGDTVIKIEAVLSGTLNYLLSEYDGSKSFSELVRVAKEIGYTEPDPRDDLSGMDVARKCLILARECGWEIELDDIVVEPMMPAESANAKDVTAFFETLDDYNTLFHQRYETAKANGKKLRYVANIENGNAKVSLIEVDAEHSFFSLKGTENCISLTTTYYQKYPMVIKGPGAGIDVTAAGVLADIVRIAEGLRT